MSTTQLGQEEVVKGSKCQDCGNQAKKECAYSRCRSCCKNKGFQCQTHIRSTWIPVDRRRQRMEQPPPPTTHQHHLQGDIPKRHKHNPFSNTYYKPIFTIQLKLQSGEFKFPAVMSSMAAFNCVRVRSMDDTVDDIAYQTTVKIGGHVFSGLLYDQGPEQSFNARGDSSIDPPDQQHNLNLFSAAIHTRDGAGATVAPLSSATAAHEFFFPPPHPLASFRPGMPYFSHPKP